MPEPIDTVVFDVGEVLVDETREYGTWADWLGVPRHTFSAVFGSVIATGGDYRDVFQVFRPGFDLTEQREQRAAAGHPETFGEEDLYPEVRSCLAALRRMGVRVGVAGNQTARAERILTALDLPVDFLATSDRWQVEKPSTAFFHRVVDEAGAPPARVLYVGDRIDNDIRPAQSVGVTTALVRRGPWGRILRDPEVETRCLFLLDDLVRLPEIIGAHNAHHV